MSLGKSHESNGVRVRSTRLENDESMIKNHHDPIISPTVFNRAMAIRDERTGESKRIYAPHLGRTSPFYAFVYSLENSKFLNYRIEHSKNKYEIPTLYCYNKHHKNRVSMSVDNLFLLLNNAKNRLLNFIKQIRHFSNMNEVEVFKRLVRVVEMVDRQTYNIRLALVEDNSLNFCLLNSKVTLKVGAKNRDVTFFYLSLRVRHLVMECAARKLLKRKGPFVRIKISLERPVSTKKSPF